ncbi:DNA-3-methyladenine glycosylase family protein [Oxalobacteraceae bacterium A2-2]
MTLSYELPLPEGYRLHDILAFHSRDAHSVAEEVSAQRLRKGMLLDGVPVVLDIVLPPLAALSAGGAAAAVPGPSLASARPGGEAAGQPYAGQAIETPGATAGTGAAASVTINADGALTPAAEAQARQAALGMLGLRLDPAPFSAAVADDPLLGAIVRAQPGLRVVQSATVFEALTWAIIGQQINLPFAISLRRSFILQAGRQHSSGLWCYPAAADAARLAPEQLGGLKFSRAKAETLARFARLVADGALRLEPGPDHSIEQISAALLAVKGIGPWTVNYGLLRGYAYADCSLHGDVAIRAALHALLGGEQRPGIAQAEQFLQRYRPHRTMAAAHLWASLHPRGTEA